jgi:hypothetical protein
MTTSTEYQDIIQYMGAMCKALATLKSFADLQPLDGELLVELGDFYTSSDFQTQGKWIKVESDWIVNDYVDAFYTGMDY